MNRHSWSDLKKQLNAHQAGAEDAGQGSPPGAGNQGNGAPPFQAPCRQDVRQFCGEVQPGGGRIVNCLLDHQNEISDSCYGALAKRKGAGR